MGKFDGHFEKHETLFYVSSERKYTEFLVMHRHIVVSGTDNIKQNKEQNTHGLTDKLPTNLKAMFLHWQNTSSDLRYELKLGENVCKNTSQWLK